MTAPLAARPGLVKTRGEPLLRTRQGALVCASVGRVRAWFDRADVMTEGAMRREGDAAIWYGTTSLILPWPEDFASPTLRAFLAAVAARDPHVRLRALRLAHQEASLRAPAPLGRAECETRLVMGDSGLRIDVDVQAPLTLPSHLGVAGGGPRV